ncbi:hypothetical protein OL239_18810 [Arthrobacter sp. ATA002]|nr:hypothetical protein [Arthrobacter sp. ATA002]WAP51753.1 hypothetical protein OL239_18810 [Arthrobacter sp. ATA002]
MFSWVFGTMPVIFATSLRDASARMASASPFMATPGMVLVVV